MSPQYAPHIWIEPSYVSKVKMDPVNTSQKSNKKESLKFNPFLDDFLYYAR